MKLLGGVLILAAAVCGLLCYSGERRRYLALLEDTAASLELLGSILRWKKVPVPEALASLQQQPYCGACFIHIAEYLKRNITLQSAWEKGFEMMPAEIRHAMAQVEWRGDEERILSSVQYAAAQLRRCQDQSRRTLRQQRKLFGAAAVCGAALLVIILA